MTSFVVYRTQTGALMKARVVTRHRDGDLTVEPWHWMDDANKSFQGGHKLRIAPSYLVSQTPEDRDMTEQQIQVGDRVEGGEGDDHDTGRVVEINEDTATVAWDSGVRTPAPLSILRRV